MDGPHDVQGNGTVSRGMLITAVLVVREASQVLVYGKHKGINYAAPRNPMTQEALKDNQSIEAVVTSGDRESFGGRGHGGYRWLPECRSGDGSCRG
jgi:hypothetical protein